MKLLFNPFINNFQFSGEGFIGEIRAINRKILEDAGINWSTFLPSSWVECNGQEVEDPESPLYGQTVPDLNGYQDLLPRSCRFLRGDYLNYGIYGGADSVTLTINNLPSHVHGIPISNATGSSNTAVRGGLSAGSIQTQATGAGQPFGILPQYYNIIWIMKIK